jgi:hypothetical protein
MELAVLDTVAAPRIRRFGAQTIELAAGKHLWVYSGPIMNPATNLDAEVPAGKKWTVNVSVQVTETDA